MEEISDDEYNDITTPWVKKLRSRFARLGVSTPAHSENDYSPTHGTEIIKNSRKIPPYNKEVEKSRVFVNRHQNDTSNLLTSRQFQETPNGMLSNNESSNTPTALPNGEESLNLKHFYSQGNKFPLNDSEFKENSECLGKTKNGFLDHPLLINEFYTRPQSATSTRSWHTRDWRGNSFDTINSRELEVSSQTGSYEENVDLMLDWWGLNNLKKTSELRKYLPDSRKSANNAKKIGYSSDDLKNDCVLKQRANESEDHFHVFPVGFDEGHDLGKDYIENSVPNLDYFSSDSDFTIDDPEPKPKSPRAVNGIPCGNSLRSITSPRNSYLSHSKSPPVPQIQGLLYHGFSNKEPTTKQEVQAADTDIKTWRIHQRPRALSQPSITKDHFEIDDQNSSVLCGFLNITKDLEFEQNNLTEKEYNNKSEEQKVFESVGNVSSKFILTNDILSNPNDKKGLDMNVLVCPLCTKVNSTSANWCNECGKVLVNITSNGLKQHDGDLNKTNTQLKEPCESLRARKLSENEKPEAAFKERKLQKNVSKDGRRWEKSSLAWSTYEDSHLSKPPGVKNKTKGKKTGAERRERPWSASSKSSVERGNDIIPNLTNVGSCPKSGKRKELKNKKKTSVGRDKEMKVNGNRAVDTRLPYKKHDLAIDLSGLDDYGEITQMIRSNRGHALPYLCLPDEIILHILSCLSQLDLARCSQVCRQLRRICEDECLWNTIVLRKNQNICDEFLEKIGSKKPISLSMIQCRGNQVTSSGLRELFRRCGDNLEELNFSGCNGGQLIGESILLHVSVRCNKLQSVDASWSNVGDNGITALVENVERLECLCLNGCQAITDHSLKVIADKHGQSLKTFEIFGCFNVSAHGIKRLGQKCPNLQTLNLGQCYKITSAAIGQIVSHLESIVNLDLRGCKQARDACVKTIAKHCPLLVNLVLANCPLISDVAMTEIAANLPSVRCLDICGCVKVTDQGVRALAQSCNRLNYLDLSSTSITKKSVMLLANYCSQNLESLKLSFCVNVTDDSVSRLVRHCKRMTTLHLYGCKRLRNVEALQKLNQSLKLEF